MPSPRLSTLLRRLQQRAQQTEDAMETGAGFFSQGTIKLVRNDGQLTVELGDGRTVVAMPTTDEAFQFGQHVWVSEAADRKFIVHGGVR